MKLRTKFILAFLLLAVVPLAGIVSYSYFSSLRAVQRTVESEARVLTADMNERMDSIEREVQRRVEKLEGLPLHRLLRFAPEGERTEVKKRLLDELGVAAALVEEFEFRALPEAPAPFEPPAAPGVLAPDVPAPGSSLPRWETAPESDTIVLRITENEGAEAPDTETDREPIVFRITEEGSNSYTELSSEEFFAEKGAEFGIQVAEVGLEVAEVIAGAFGESLGETLITEDEKQELEEELLEAAKRARAERRKELAEARRKVREERAERRRQVLETSEEKGSSPKPGWLFREKLELPVIEQGERIGEFTTKIRGERLVGQVLARTRRDQGEVPYALTSEGKLFVAEESDETLLEGLPLDRPGVAGDWVITTSEVPGSDWLIGIARPIEKPLAEIRRTAAINFGAGLGLIVLALLGVLPLSRRMTRDLGVVTAGAERIASGDLATRLPVRSRDELGQLASAFNDMARDLEQQQEQLVEQERMEVEYARKSRELEEARQFQLSLLPADLPRHPSFEVAVHMQTAQEVGGDYYDFHLDGDGTLTAAIGDATGHGARAGTMVTVVKSLFSAYSSSTPRGAPNEFLAEANRTIRRMDLERMAMTLTLAQLRGNRLTITAAGMPPALVHRAATGELEEIELRGMPLGGLERSYQQREIELQPGDKVLLMTDGFPELLDPEGEVMGYGPARDAFAATAEAEPRQIVASLAEAVAEWTGGESPADDVTFVVLAARDV